MRRPLFRCVVVAAMVAAVVATPAQAETPDSLTFTGRGYGHGRGMGQWGAKAIAERGRSYTTILRYYYDGITIAKLASEPAIRVHVGTVDAAMITSSSAFDAYEIGGTAIASGTTGVIRVRIDGTRNVVERAATYEGPWRVLRRTTRNIGFVPRRSMLQVAETDGGFRTYRGSIAVKRGSASALWIIVTSGLQEYLRGVVPREMPSTWPDHALRAQAVAARTYAVRAMRLSREKGREFDICSTTSCQVFGGARRRTEAGKAVEILERDTTDAAIAATRAIVMTYQGEVIFAQFSSSTGGHTAPGSQPYLAAKPDPYDRISPHHEWTKVVDDAKIEAAYPAIGDLERIVVTERNGYGPDEGRVVSVLIDGTNGTLTRSGTSFRRAVGLRSDWFSV
jgi:stage II sporulation protein D